MNNLFKPSHLKQLCQEYNLSPSKKYGQNYLISQGVIEKIIKASDLKKTDTVIEIGPGFGVLTFALAECVGKVVSFEIERKLEGYWEEIIEDLKIKGSKDQGDIEIMWGNALTEIKNQSSNLSVFQSSYKVVANLPYQITSNILRTLLELENKPESITVMVQKEVAERICAKPGKMSLLAVSVQYYGKPKIIAKVPKGNFWPSPKVDSAILHLSTLALQHFNTFTDKEFFGVVRAGFSNKRKQLWRNLKSSGKWDGERVKNILKEVCGNEKVRAEELSVEQWLEIVKRLK